MRLTGAPLIALLGGAATAAADEAFQRNEQLQGRAVQHSTSVSTILSTSVVTVPITISKAITKTGVKTLIPNLVTMTFDHAPAYVYLETVSMSTATHASYVTKSVRVTSTTTPKTTSTTKKTTSKVKSKATATSKPTATSSAYVNPPQDSDTNDCPSYVSQPPNTPYNDPNNTNKFPSQCGSGRTCVNGKCYYLAADNNNCGSVNNVVSTSPPFIQGHIFPTPTLLLLLTPSLVPNLMGLCRRHLRRLAD